MAELKRLRGVLMVALLIAGFCSSARAHPFHVTIAEAEWNAKTRSLEVSLRVNPLDLERMLRGRLKRSVELVEGDKKIEAAVFEYVKKQLIITAPDKKVLSPKWVGMEVKINRAWLYFEYPMPNPPIMLRVEHRVFHELETDQVNTMLLKVEGRKFTRHFTRHKARHEMPFVGSAAAAKSPETEIE